MAERREMVSEAISQFELSERQACRLFNLSRTVYRYQAKRKDDSDIRQRLQELAERKPRWGLGKMYGWLRQQGYSWNRKRVRRVYREMKLNLRIKPKKRLPKREPQPLVVPEEANHTWSMAFMSDSLTSGRPFRTFNIIDDFNREALWIEIDTSLPAARVVRVLDMLASWRGYPTMIRSDNGPEFISKRLEQWAATHQVKLDFIEPGKPAQNAYIERFNRTYRDEVLDIYLFHSLQDVRVITETWLEEYNGIRPHDSLGGTPPYQYAALAQAPC